MGVDFGDARTGISVSTPSESLASPLCVIKEYNMERCCEKTAEKAKECGAQLIVVGKPLNMNGTSGERAEKCSEFAKHLAELTGLPVEMWDERSTTVSAHNYLNATNTRGKNRKNVIDAVAAVIILESYLGYRSLHRK